MRRLLGIFAGVLLAVVLTGCKVDTVVAVDAKPDGSGRVSVVVSLDKEAVDAAGDLRKELVVDDLRRAGWRIDGPVPVAGGGARITATKPFRSPNGANEALDELTGPSGALSSLELE